MNKKFTGFIIFSLIIQCVIFGWMIDHLDRRISYMDKLLYNQIRYTDNIWKEIWRIQDQLEENQ